MFAIAFLFVRVLCDCFKSRRRLEAEVLVLTSIGPQIGYLFPVGNMQGYLGLKGYWEFAAQNRPEGWNTWLTFAISPTAPIPPPAQGPLIHK
jgi:Putative MetA-pathway of phenol degradation